MKNELIKRIVTSFFLIILLYLMISYKYVLIFSLIIISIIAFIEFDKIMSRIFTNKKVDIIFIKFSIKIISFFYLFFFSFLIFDSLVNTGQYFKLNIIYVISVCIFSDIGGFVFGKTFKGRKLTKISPNKTIAGSIGSFILPLFLAPLLNLYMKFEITELLLITIIVSLFCQIGDIFVSYLKRKAALKDTGKFLPGHGGVLDRLDGILFAVPLGSFIWKIFILL